MKVDPAKAGAVKARAWPVPDSFLASELAEAKIAGGEKEAPYKVPPSSVSTPIDAAVPVDRDRDAVPSPVPESVSR